MELAVVQVLNGRLVNDGRASIRYEYVDTVSVKLTPHSRING